MLDHIGLCVNDYEKSKTFYTTALKPLGMSLLIEVQGFAGFGSAKNFSGFGSASNEGPIAEFWLHQGTPVSHLHFAFRAKTRQDVDAFYEAALKAGGADNGKPGIREMYHPNYYGAFILDPDGNNIEAVCHS